VSSSVRGVVMLTGGNMCRNCVCTSFH
jgi:hypothetical protein